MTLVDLVRATCAGNLEGCSASSVRTSRGAAWHPDRVTCRHCGISSRWAVWRADLGAHLCMPCDLEGTGAWS